MKIASYEDMVQCYSDTFKEYHGVRPLYIRSRSYEELGNEIEQLRSWIAEDLAQERADEDASINACMAVGAPDIDTAMRWLEDANVHSVWA